MTRLTRSTLVLALLAGCNCGGKPAGGSSTSGSATSTASGSTTATSSASGSTSAGATSGSSSAGSGSGSASVSSTGSNSTSASSGAVSGSTGSTTSSTSTGSGTGSTSASTGTTGLAGSVSGSTGTTGVATGSTSASTGTTGTSASTSTTSTGSGGSTGGGQTQVQTTLSCQDHVPGGNTWTTSVDVSSVNICEAFTSSQELVVDIRDSQDFAHLHVHLLGFTGVGTYTTQGAVEDAGNYVALRAPADPNGDCCTDVDSSLGPNCPTPSCMINVTNADLLSAPTGSPGRLTLTVTCPQLVGTGVACVTCDLGPSSITLDIPDCSSS